MTGEAEAVDRLAALEYEAALFAFEQVRASGSEAQERILAGRASALLGLRRFAEALELLVAADDLSRVRSCQDAGLYGDNVATAMWLAGQRVGATQYLRLHVRGILSRKIQYTDLSGGVGVGILLSYAATAIADADATEVANAFLRNRAKRAAVRDWPGPLARLLLGQQSSLDVVQTEFGVSSLEAAIGIASERLIVRRRLVQLLFAAAVVARASGNDAECRRLMISCSQLRNPLIQNEWYLARAEAEGEPVSPQAV